tara:strand:- start:94 stop:969 length:876 start_codon:yes stop_codon:yes gene_type:complete
MDWITKDYGSFYKDGAPGVEWYNKSVLKRRELYPNWQQLRTNESDKIAEEVDNKGYCVIKDFWNLSLLDKLKEKTYELINSGDSKLLQVASGGRHTQIYMPTKNVSIVNELAMDHRIISIATSFLNCIPGLGTTNLRLSKANNLEPAGTNMYHRDFNSIKFIKFFTYLNDVSTTGGPFTYVEGSNSKLPPNWQFRHRWSDEQIEELYGKDSIKPLTANYGDLIVGTTNGFHKGALLEKGERLMLTLNYTTHVELGDPGIYGPANPRHQILKETYENTEDDKKALYDFMEVV